MRAGELLESFVKQFYAGTPFIPQEIWLQEELSDTALLTDWLSAKRGARVKLVVPKKGQKEKLMELAARNADMILERTDSGSKWTRFEARALSGKSKR